jgi:hypothetical protein
VRRAFLAFLPPTHAQARPWAAYAGTRVWPSIIGRVFDRAAARIPAGRCKGKKGREWMSGGADRLTGGLLLGESKRRPHLWDRRGFGAGEPSVGAALPGKLDGLEWSASTVLLGGKRSPGASSLSMFCGGNERAAEPGVHALPRASRNRMFADASLFEVSSRGSRLLPLRERHMAFLGPDSTAAEVSPTGGCCSCAAKPAEHQ